MLYDVAVAVLDRADEDARPEFAAILPVIPDLRLLPRRRRVPSGS
jgi:hypothetical protein